MDTYLILAKQWHRKSYGGTYQKVYVYKNHQLIATSEETYGYGEQYLTTACELLQDAGLWPKDDVRMPATGEEKNVYDFRMAVRDHPEIYFHDLTIVSREKDL